MKATFTRQELLAALLFASTDESRFVLNGLCVTYRPGRKPIVTSTDGRRLCVIESAAEQVTGQGSGNERQIILSAAFVKPICALNKVLDGSKGKIFPLITFENKPGSIRLFAAILRDEVHLEAESGAIIEGNYPDWKQVVPPKRAERQPVSQLGMNAEYVGDFAKAAKIFERDMPQVQMSLVGKDSAIEIAIPGVPNFYGLFMPVRADDNTEFQPEFLGIVEGLPKPQPEPEPEKDEDEAPHITIGPEEASAALRKMSRKN